MFNPHLRYFKVIECSFVIVILLIFSECNLYAQKRIIFPYIEDLDSPDFIVDSVFLSSEDTKVFCTYSNNDNDWANISERMYLRDNDHNMNYGVLSSVGLPLSPEKKQLKNGEIVSVILFFPRIADCSSIDIIEHENTQSFNLYGIDLSGNRHRLSAGEHAKISNRLFCEGVDLYNSKSYDEAIIKFEECKHHDKYNKLSSIYNEYDNEWIGSSYFKIGKEELAREYCEFYKHTPTDRRKTLLSDSLLNIAFKYQTNNENGKYLECLKKAFKLQKETSGNNNLNYTSTLDRIGYEYERLDSFESAYRYYEESYKTRVNQLEGDHKDIGVSLVRMASCLFEIGNDSLAFVYCTNGFRILKAHNLYECFLTATVLDKIGLSFFHKKNYDAALRYELESVSMIKSVGTSQDNYYKASIAKIYNTVMICSMLQGNMGDAIKYGKRAANIRSEVFGQQHPLYINTASTLASCYSNAGKYNEAYKIDSICLESFRPEKINYGNYYISNSIYLNLLSGASSFLSKAQRFHEEEQMLIKAMNATENSDSLKHIEFVCRLAKCYENQNRYDEAIKSFNQCISFYKELNLKDSVNSLFIDKAGCYSLSNKIDEWVFSLINSDIIKEDSLFSFYDSVTNGLIEKKEWNAALGFYNKKIELLNRAKGDVKITINTLDDKAFCLDNLERYSDELECLSKALSLCDDDSVPKQWKAELYAQIALYYESLNNIDSAIIYGKQAFDIGKTIEGNNIWCIERLSNLCRFCVQNKNLKLAEKYGLEALSIASENLQESKSTLNELFFNLYSIYFNLSDARKQLDILQKYFNIPNLEKDQFYLFLLSSMAYAYNYLNMPNMNIATLEKYINLYRIVNGKGNKLIYRPMVRLAKALYQNGQYSKAISIGSSAMDIVTSSANIYSENYVEALFEMADYYSVIGNYGKSKVLLTSAKKIVEETFEESTSTGKQCQNLSKMYECINDTINAIKYAKLAVEKYDPIQDGILFMRAERRLAHLFSRAGSYQESNTLQTKLLDEDIALHSNESEEVAQRLFDMANNYECMGELKTAIKYYVKALESNTKAYNSNKELNNSIMEGLATTYIDLGEYVKSYEYLSKVIENERTLISKDFLNLQSHDKEHLWEQNKSIFLNILPNLAICSGNSNAIESMYDNTFLFAKGLISYTENTFNFYANRYPEIKFFQNEIIKKNIYREKQLRINEERRITDIDQIDKEIRSLNDSITNICFRNNLTGEFVNVSWKDVRNVLKDSDVVVEFYAISDSNYSAKGELYVACVIKKSYKTPRLIKLFYEKDFMDISDDLDSIYSVVWLPLENEFAKNIYFSPWNKLTNKPIEYATNSKGECLSDLYNCFRLSSSRELVVNSSPKTIHNIVLYGGLKYDATIDEIQTVNKTHDYNSNSEQTFRGVTDSIIGRSGFDYLPFSLKEVNDIYDLCKSKMQNNETCELFEGEYGTEESFKSLYGKDINLIHIATHGAFIENKESTYYNKIFHEDEDTKYSLIDNSLSRTFMVMSGGDMLCKSISIPDGMDDGILSAKEISKLNFQDLELVVISTCNSGVGDYSSEGTMGLQQGFKKAGAKSILMTLNYIDDKATQMLMVEFYKNLLSGKSKFESLRDAQRYLRTTENGKYKDPKYWTSFILLDAIN